MSLHLYNTITKKLQPFEPINSDRVGLYTCGPTVYNYAHLGNLRSYIFADVLKRALVYNQYAVNQVMNITDVGHLTDDADQGEDKMEAGARREHKTAWEIAEFYTAAFKKDLGELNIGPPTIWCKATDHIAEQIALIQKLEEKGFTYTTSDGVYFDTSKLPDYGKLAGLKKADLKAGARVEMGEKKQATDFALWKLSQPTSQRQMEWPSPWGTGFPGWHIECSAMSVKYLGQPFDIHTGGIDHIPVHHTNEIAQSEAAEGKPLANFWLHGEFLLLEDSKMAKSGEHFLTLQKVIERGLPPLAYRYFVLQTHYRKQLTFSWEAVKAGAEGLDHLYRAARKLTEGEKREGAFLEEQFLEHVNDDLDIPGGLAAIWKAIKRDEISIRQLLKFDEVLGLRIKENLEEIITELPTDVAALIEERNAARTSGNWKKSDELRDQLEEMGYTLEDGAEGTRVVKK